MPSQLVTTSQIVMPSSVVSTSQIVTTPQIIKPKPSYKNMMADIMKPLPKDDTKPNIHLGGGQFTKLEKI